MSRPNDCPGLCRRNCTPLTKMCTAPRRQATCILSLIDLRSMYCSNAGKHNAVKNYTAWKNTRRTHTPQKQALPLPRSTKSKPFPKSHIISIVRLSPMTSLKLPAQFKQIPFFNLPIECKTLENDPEVTKEYSPN